MTGLRNGINMEQLKTTKETRNILNVLVGKGIAVSEEKIGLDDKSIEKYLRKFEKETIRFSPFPEKKTLFEVAETLIDTGNVLYEINGRITGVGEARKIYSKIDIKTVKEKMEQKLKDIALLYFVAIKSVDEIADSNLVRFAGKISSDVYTFVFTLYYSYFIKALLVADKENLLPVMYLDIRKDIAAMENDVETANIELNAAHEIISTLQNENEKLKNRKPPTIDTSEIAKDIYKKSEELAKLHNDNLSLQEKISEKQREIDDLSSLLTISETERAELQTKYDVLAAEFADCNIEYIDETPAPESKVLLKKYIFVGGYDAVIVRLKEKFLNSRFICSENDKLTSSHVNQCDYIIYLTKYMNHATYNKMRVLSKKNNLKEIHISASGENAIIDTIIDEVISNDK